MTKNEARKAVLNRAGGRASATNLDDELYAEMDLAQTELESLGTLPWFSVTSVSDTLAADTRTIVLPSDFIREWDQADLKLLNAAGNTQITLEKKTFEELDAKRALTANNDPEFYTIIGDNIHIYPKADAAWTYTLYYHKKDTSILTLSSGAENNWLKWFPTLLIAKTAMNVKLHIMRDRDPSGLQLLNAEYTSLLRQIEVMNTAREEANMNWNDDRVL
jgi:hypothetical protein